MRRLTRTTVLTGMALTAGAVLALTGCTPDLGALAAFSRPVSWSSPPVGGHSVPHGHRHHVGDHSVPVGVHSAPRCVIIRTPGGSISVGSASGPTPCTTITTGPGAGSGPVGGASAPHCVVITTPRSTLRAC